MELFFPIFSRVSQIKAWLLDKTGLFNFFSSLSIIDKTGKAVHETNNASASFKSIFESTSVSYTHLTLPTKA